MTDNDSQLLGRTGPSQGTEADQPNAVLLQAKTMSRAKSVLKKHFGYKHFRQGQEAVVHRVLAGKSTLALLPTGGGKSLCYQVPALLLRGTTLVISPLLALMRDQVAALQAKNIPAARLDSTLSLAEQEGVLAELSAGKLKLLYLSPERLLQPACLAVLQTTPCSLIAVDEAHCLVEWGHNFRPDYLRLARLPSLFPSVPILALTATATPPAVEAIRQAFALPSEAVIRTPMARPNLRLAVLPTVAARRPSVLAKRLAVAGRLPAIVYVTRQETAESVATSLQRAGFSARAYHAGLPDETRSEAQDAFLSGTCQVMVATTAFGMGIDLPGVRAVFHYDLPRSLENYLQETGRAGRDGKNAHGEMLASAEEWTVLENYLVGDTPTPEALRLCLDCFLRQGPSPAFSRWQLSRRADVRPAVLDTLLARLEMAGLMTPGPSTWLTCRVKLVRAETRLAAGHPPQQQAWIQHLLVKKERVWGRIPIDLRAAAEALETEPEVLADFLQELELSGDLVVRPVERQETWQLNRDSRAQAATDWIAESIASLHTAEASARARLEEVLAFFTAPGCLSRRLLAYFGENEADLLDCGVCTRCRNPDKAPLPLPIGPERAITLAEAGQIRELVRARHPALRHPRQLARFLCGISSPAAQRDKLTKHECFGLLATVPFDTVLAHAEASV